MLGVNNKLSWILTLLTYVYKSLTRILNLSLKTGILSCDGKNAMVTPMFKDVSKIDSNNYRPISVISVVAKILKKAIFNL